MGAKKGGATGPHARQILAVRGTEEWRAWLEYAANAKGLSSSAVLDVALAAWAQQEGLEPPPRRTGGGEQ